MLASGTTLAIGITSRSQGELVLKMVLHSLVPFSYAPFLLPCFWETKLQLTSVLAHILCEQSLGPITTLPVGPLASTLLQRFLEILQPETTRVFFPFSLFCQGNCFPFHGTSLLTLCLTQFQKYRNKGRNKKWSCCKRWGDGSVSLYSEWSWAASFQEKDVAELLEGRSHVAHSIGTQMP